MLSTPVDEFVWAEGIAARLKLLQASCADEPSAKRQEYLGEEIGRALKEVAPGQRKVFLAALAQQFPAWEGGASAAEPAAAKPGTAPERPEEILERLLQAIPQLSAETLEEFIQKLAAAGLVKVEKSTARLEVSEELKKRLGLATGQSLLHERAVRLLALLLQEMLKLDSLAWETWSKMAPKSGFRKEARGGADVKTVAERYLTTDSEEASLQIHQLIEKTRKLIAGLLGAIPGGGRKFAEEFIVRFLPKNIEDIAGARGGGIFGDSMEKRCWNKYKELAYPDTDSIEKRLKDAIAKQAEEMATRG